MRYRLLGPFRVEPAISGFMPRAAKPRSILALLVSRANCVVRRDELIDEVWPDVPPRSAVNTLHSYVVTIRKSLDLAHTGRFAEPVSLGTVDGGYVLNVPSQSVDCEVFDEYRQSGIAALHGGQAGLASTMFSRALALWDGPALADVTCGRLLQAQVERLEEARISTVEQRIEAELRLGRHHDVLTELSGLVNAHPFNENLRAQQMVALYRSGRRHAALESYRALNAAMRGALGLDPSAALRNLHRSILADESRLFNPFIRGGERLAGD